MQKEFDDARAVAIEMALEVHDRAIARLPERLFAAAGATRQALRREDFRMNPDDQHLLVIRTVEDADLAALRQIAGGAPQEVVLELDRARMLVAEHLAALRIDPRHHVCDDAILAGRIHGLKNEQYGVAAGRVQELLPGAELLHVLLQELLVFFIRAVDGSDAGRPCLEIHGGAFAYTVGLGIDLHRRPPSLSGSVKTNRGAGLMICPSAARGPGWYAIYSIPLDSIRARIK